MCGCTSERRGAWGWAETSEEGTCSSLPVCESNLELVVVICAGSMVTLRTHRDKSSSKGSVYSVQWFAPLLPEEAEAAWKDHVSLTGSEWSPLENPSGCGSASCSELLLLDKETKVWLHIVTVSFAGQTGHWEEKRDAQSGVLGSLYL